MTTCRRCSEADVTLVMDFIDQHWKAGHVLAVDRELFDWQYRAENGNYNFMLAERDGELIGVLGYIPTCRYDPALVDNNVVWLALWKALAKAGAAGAGLRLLSALQDVMPNVGLAVSGINPAHPPMYRALGYETGEQRLFYVLRPGCSYPLLRIPEGSALPFPRPGETTCTEMTAQSLCELRMPSRGFPEKTPLYFRNRFVERHPRYVYKVHLLSDRQNRRGLLAYRVAEHGGSRVLRIVDFCGEPEVVGGAGSCIAQWLAAETADYADFWQTGIDETLMRQAGFMPVDPQGSVVVPNYFEPFLQRNGRIEFALKRSNAARPILCRADGDQDRPNTVAVRR